MRSATLGPEATRELLVEHVETLRELPSFHEPHELEIPIYAESVAYSMEVGGYYTGRGKSDIAYELNMRMSDFEAMFIGKSVLDIGCGKGKLSRELSYLKKTKVTALDEDEQVIKNLQEKKNLRKVIGSGLRLDESIGDEKYDVVVSAFSTMPWARDPESKRLAITSAIDVCETGGKVILIPIMQLLGYRAAVRNKIRRAIVEQGMNLDMELAMIQSASNTADWLDVLAMDTLTELEEEGKIACSFTSSPINDLNLPANTMHRDGDPAADCYSVIIDVN